MDLGLKGKTALVLGAGGGLGSAIAATLAAEGAKVALGDIDLAAAGAVAERIAAVGGEAMALKFDLSDLAGIDARIAEIEAKLGPVDVLINNTGGPPPTPAAGQDPALWAKSFNDMVLSVIAIADRVLPGMRARKWGRIVNVLSSTARTPAPMGAPTAISRWAGYAMTKIMAGELAADGILVNAVGVGSIESDQWPRMHKERASHMSYDQFITNESRTIPLGRFGKAEEFANAVCFLVSDQASYITGAALAIDGGKSPAI